MVQDIKEVQEMVQKVQWIEKVALTEPIFETGTYGVPSKSQIWIIWGPLVPGSAHLSLVILCGASSNPLHTSFKKMVC